MKSKFFLLSLLPPFQCCFKKRPKVCTVFCITLERLSKDDGYGNENVSPKYNLALSQVFPDYSVLFTLYSTGELSCDWMGTNGFKVKTENDCLICSRCRQNLKSGDFTLLFCGVRQKIHGNSCCTCSTIIFLLINQ